MRKIGFGSLYQLNNHNIRIDYARYWEQVIGDCYSYPDETQSYIVLVLESKEDMKCFYQFLIIAKKNNMNLKSIWDAIYCKNYYNEKEKVIPNLIIKTIDAKFNVKTIDTNSIIEKIRLIKRKILVKRILVIFLFTLVITIILFIYKKVYRNKESP